MRSQIDYHLVVAGTKEFEDLQAFAKTFDHEIHPHPSITVYAYYSEGVLFGYGEYVYIPTAYPSFHPEFTKPKNVLQVMSDFRATTQLSSKVGFVGVPLPEDPKRVNFPEATMNKLGLKRALREIFVTV